MIVTLLCSSCALFIKGIRTEEDEHNKKLFVERVEVNEVVDRYLHSKLKQVLPWFEGLVVLLVGGKGLQWRRKLKDAKNGRATGPTSPQTDPLSR
jgi:hypothetical protein